MKTASDTPPLLGRLSTLSDMARLRLLRLLARQELSVGELAKALQLPQSTVSRHLKLLRDGKWVLKRSVGTASLYELRPDALDDEARDLWQLTESQMGSNRTFQEDDARMAEVLVERRADQHETFFGRLGSEWGPLRRDLFGDHFTTEALLGFLPHDVVAADLGCGTGDATEYLAPWVKSVIAVDRELSMLEVARKRLTAFDNIEFRQGELTTLPFADGEVDLAAIFLVLNHQAEPQVTVKEAARTIRPGGTLLIVDMVAHDHEDYRHTMGHQHLGFSSQEIETWAEYAQLKLVRQHRLRPDVNARGPSLFAATMRKEK